MCECKVYGFVSVRVFVDVWVILNYTDNNFVWKYTWINNLPNSVNSQKLAAEKKRLENERERERDRVRERRKQLRKMFLIKFLWY